MNEIAARRLQISCQNNGQILYKTDSLEAQLVRKDRPAYILFHPSISGDVQMVLAKNGDEEVCPLVLRYDACFDSLGALIMPPVNLCLALNLCSAPIQTTTDLVSRLLEDPNRSRIESNLVHLCCVSDPTILLSASQWSLGNSNLLYSTLSFVQNVPKRYLEKFNKAMEDALFGEFVNSVPLFRPLLREVSTLTIGRIMEFVPRVSRPGKPLKSADPYEKLYNLVSRQDVLSISAQPLPETYFSSMPFLRVKAAPYPYLCADPTLGSRNIEKLRTDINRNITRQVIKNKTMTKMEACLICNVDTAELYRQRVVPLQNSSSQVVLKTCQGDEIMCVSKKYPNDLLVTAESTLVPLWSPYKSRVEAHTSFQFPVITVETNNTEAFYSNNAVVGAQQFFDVIQEPFLQPSNWVSQVFQNQAGQPESPDFLIETSPMDEFPSPPAVEPSLISLSPERAQNLSFEDYASEFEPITNVPISYQIPDDLQGPEYDFVIESDSDETDTNFFKQS